MIPELDDIFLPHGWAIGALREDRIEFRRDDERLTLVAEPTNESPSMPGLCTGHLWGLRCEQCVGESESGMRLGCVTTMDTAVERLLTYMDRINWIVESEGGISVGRVLELLDTDVPTGEPERWNRTPSDRVDTQPPL